MFLLQQELISIDKADVSVIFAKHSFTGVWAAFTFYNISTLRAHTLRWNDLECLKVSCDKDEYISRNNTLALASLGDEKKPIRILES